jgi:precorrin-2 dehydrogenase/sirohydrochlorin ferrochelatase
VPERKALKYYPVFLDIADKKCAVVGGGEVAARKVKRLLECGAKVSVVSPQLNAELAALKDADRISHIACEYSREFISGAALAIGATDDEQTNLAISQDAREKGIAVNIVDDPKKCDFILPSIVERGELVIAISTGGNSPALARHLREELETRYGAEYEIFLRILGNLRLQMAKNTGVGKSWFDALISSGILALIQKKDWEKVKNTVREITGQEVKIDFA